MSDTKRSPAILPGHPRYGGRKKGSQNKRTRQAIEICEALDFHPCAFLATIALTGLMPNPDGTTTPVSSDERIRAATSLAPFVMPKLQSMQVSGENGGPVEMVGVAVDLAKILADPDAARAAAALAMKLMEGNESPQIGPAPEEDVLLLESKDSAGHWKE